MARHGARFIPDGIDMRIISILRSNARTTLIDISRSTKLPVSTVFDRMRRLRPLVLKYTSLVDFSQIGRPIKLFLVVEDSALQELLQSNFTNNIYRLNDKKLLAEVVFESNALAHDFLEELKGNTITVVEEIVKEKFLADRSQHLF
jgi:DNA-binding Lrp family transcriptional regulator